MKTFDVAIAGGGLIGGAIAFELARAGLQVALFDSRQPGEGSSWAAAGILSPAPENSGMISTVPLGRASLQLYPEFVAAVEEISGQNAGYRAQGTIEALFSADAQEKLSTIIALHHGLGLKAEPVSADDAREMEPALSPELEAAVFRPDEACVDNRALTKAVLKAAERSSVKIFAASSVQSIVKNGEHCTGLLADGKRVESRWTVIAAGCWSGAIEGASQYAPVRPAKGQMIALRAKKDLSVERVLWSDYVYLVPRNDGKILAGATVEYVGFEKTVTAGGLQKIITAAVQLAPALTDAQMEETWAGLRPDAPDHLPIIGPTDLEGLLIATGHFRSGILLAPITAQLIREWITTQKVSHDWARFSPMRFGEVAKATNS
ncbi:MAG TPA: glycine oxidase ThiO [Candidatus Acidoferrum sp.]|jgi:glycine oxidase|nr:glycine oxidase ThiO [Candidatus Acidoferrum sp.]